jgi:type IV secretory pathway TrbD component
MKSLISNPFKHPPSQPRFFNTLKNGIWLYYFMVLFEGALRKWVFPSLATPLLVVRDPLVVVLLMIAIRRKILVLNGYMAIVLTVGVLSFIFAMIFGHGNLFVALYGVRILLLHFPLIFVIQKVFTHEDVIRMGKMTLWIAIPMALLITLQFYSPQSAFVNRGVGGDEEGAGFTGALGFYRPPGTFSFTNGNTLFFSMVGVFVFYFWFIPKSINKLILLGATAALVISIPFSISRGLFFQVGITIIFAGAVILRKPKYAGTAIVSSIALVLLLVALSGSSFFQTATSAFTSRFEVANKSEGGVESVLMDRYLGGLVSAIKKSYDKPFFGIGVGAGTNVGSKLLIGEQKFLGGEGEWGRLVSELGPIMGILIILVRLALSVEIVKKSYRKLVTGDTLPWMLLSFGLLTLPQGGWNQPTSLGFCTLLGGLMLASITNVPQFRRNTVVPAKVLRRPPMPGQRRIAADENISKE